MPTSDCYARNVSDKEESVQLAVERISRTLAAMSELLYDVMDTSTVTTRS